MEDKSAKGYNIDVTVKTAVDATPTVTGTPKLKFRGTFERGGKTFERTVIAMGKAADAVAAVLKTGETAKLRILFSKTEGQDGKPGGEYLTILGLPLAPKEKAA